MDPQKLQEMFQRWLENLVAMDHLRLSGTSFKLEIRGLEEFGVWLVPAVPAIRLNLGAMTRLCELVEKVVREPEFELGEWTATESADLLCELAFQWLMCHEAAHWLLGHPEYLGRNCPNLLEGICFAEVMVGVCGDTLPGLDRTENICAELQADSLAFEIISHFHAGELPFQDAGSLGSLLNTGDRFARLRACTVAAGLVILLIDTLRSSDMYPTPAARIFNLLHMTLAVANLDAVRIRESGPVLAGSDGETLRTLERSLRETVMPASFDLHAVTSILGIDTTFVHYVGPKSPTLEDLLVSIGVRKHGVYQTVGALEFAEWERQFHAKVRTSWKPFARIDSW